MRKGLVLVYRNVMIYGLVIVFSETDKEALTMQMVKDYFSEGTKKSFERS